MSEFLLQIGRLGGLREQFFFRQIFSGPAILQSSHFFRPRLAVYSGFEPAPSRSAVWYATNSANHSQNPAQLATEYHGFWSQSGFHYAKPSRNLGLNINGTLCKGGNVLENWSRTSLTSRSGPKQTSKLGMWNGYHDTKGVSFPSKMVCKRGWAGERSLPV